MFNITIHTIAELSSSLIQGKVGPTHKYVYNCEHEPEDYKINPNKVESPTSTLSARCVANLHADQHIRDAL